MQVPSLKSFLSDRFSKLMAVYLLWMASWILAGSLFEVYFYGLGLTMQEIVLTAAFWGFGSLLITPFFKKIESRKFMLVGIAIGFLSAVLLYFLNVKEAGYLFRFMISLTHLTFWIPFNITFYEFRKNNNAALASIYYSVGPLLTLLLPGVGGYIASVFGYSQLYLLSMAAYAITFIVAFMLLENKKYEYDLMESIKSIKGLRTIIFLEGFAAAAMVQVTAETMLLKFADTPLEFGVIISVATAFSIIASVLTAKISDKRKRRRELLILSAIALGIAGIITGISNGIAQFFIGFALINFLKTVFFPFPFALAIDNSKNLVKTIVGREYVLNIGRVSGALAGFFLLYYFDISAMMLFNGIALLVLFPLAFEHKKKGLEKI